jgi:hypothetical protein
VAQSVQPHPLGDVGGLRSLDDHAIEMPRADRLHRMLLWKQAAVAMLHALLGSDLPPLAQKREQVLRHHCVPVSPALPRSTLSSMGSLSTSATFSVAISATRRPAP